MRIAGLGLLVLSAATIAACSDSTGGSTGGHGNAITVSNNSFNPNPDTAAVGVVTFTWTNASNSHNVTWSTGPTTPANSATMTTGTYQATLAQGTYTYHCTVHQGMNGTIVVE
ncbi:MAG TPA: cupredoxin domain-containing protein [Gemmatimonadales bacterium]|nr:cupredoxin domain-containing protein [Gemmatimonadales bacterium]